MNAAFQEAVRYIEGTPLFTQGRIDPSDVRTYLDLLGEDAGEAERAYDPHVIHVAGTNGKGSVTSCLSLALRKSGYSVGTFTSPHLVNITERIRLNGEDIPEDDFARCFAKAMDAVRKGRERGLQHPAYFALLFLIAMAWYREVRPDFLVLETGIGGRLDATNSLLKKDLCIITRIDYDHTQVLGSTLSEIAGEKAGIFREGVPVVCLREPEEAFSVLKARADALSSPLYPVSCGDYEVNYHRLEGNAQEAGKGHKIIDFSMRCRYDDRVRGEIDVPLFVHAFYQGGNMAEVFTACLVLRSLGFSLPQEAVRDAIGTFRMEGRLEEVLPGFFVDGAHNPGAMRAFLREAKALLEEKEEIPAVLLFAAMKDKDYTQEIRGIERSGLFSKVVPVKLSGSRAFGREEVEALRAGMEQPELLADLEEAGEALARWTPEAARGRIRLFAAGSLYLVGAAKRFVSERSEESAEGA